MDLDKSIEQYRKYPPVVLLTIDSPRVADKIEEIGELYKMSLFGLYIYIFTGEVSQDGIVDFLKREYGASKLTAERAAADLEVKVLKPIEKRLNFLNPDPHKKMMHQEEKQIILELLGLRLVQEMNNHPIIVKAVNDRIFNALSKELGFKEEMEKVLYKNMEKITHKRFILDEKPHAPSVRNWLKYFFKLKGTDMFDNVVLSSFITKSENAKRLDDEERKMLSKLLILYRNIKFFPNSMPSDDGTGWEIIPVDEIEPEKKAKKPNIPKKSGSADLIDKLGGNIDDYAPGSLEREILEEESEEDREYQKLMLLANKYPEGSLERRAIEDEMKKFKE